MKKQFILFVTLLTFFLTSFGQSLEGINYQAVIRDASNNILSSQNVGIQFRLLQGSPAGTAAYTETHNSTTDNYGLVALVLGEGTTNDDFSTIDWSNGPYFLEIAADVSGGTSYSILGTQQLMSVPYALYAKTSENTGPINELIDSDSDTYVQVENTTDIDRIRLKIGASNSYIELKEESADRLNLAFLNTDGDILIGENTGKNIRTVSVTENNILIGDDAGTWLRGARNIILGKEAGVSSSSVGSQYDNIILGYKAAGNTFSGSGNIAIGSLAGLNIKNSNDNVYLGYQAGTTSEGQRNIAIGYQAGRDHTGSESVFIGYKAGLFELNSERLYISNSSTTGPLIYGEFDNNLLRINGTLNINNAFSFPIVDGTQNQILKTDGNGQVFWAVDSGQVAPQQISLSGNTLSLSGGGGSVNFNFSSDDLGNHTATQNIKLSNNWLSNDGGNEGIKIADDGKVKIGTNGSFVSEIIKVTKNRDVTNISSNSFEIITFTVTGAKVRGTVSISPASELPGKVLIASARVSGNNTVMVKFVNPGNSGQNPASMNYYITVINE